MTALALDGRQFEPSGFRPAWLRPTVVALVVALHAAALATLPYLSPKPPEKPREVIVDVEAPAEAAPPEPATAPPPPEAVAPPAPPRPEAVAPPAPQPEAVAPSPPPSVESPAPVVATPPPERLPPAPVELAPKPPPLLPRTEPAKPQVKPVPRLAPKPEPARPMPRKTEAKPPPAAKPATSEAEQPSAPRPGAASQTAYISAMAAAIRSRLFYPPAARARDAKGVVGVAFTIGASGALAAFAITRSSGDADLDAAARTLVQSTHFPPPPGGSVRVATSFNYVPR